ncbi:MAG: hypothetical protein M5R36_16215 [Deltaproteobacteria bacterium]|nr:hypothetical protein [Deltaproteobacteria bacterium]
MAVALYFIMPPGLRHFQDDAFISFTYAKSSWITALLVYRFWTSASTDTRIFCGVMLSAAGHALAGKAHLLATMQVVLFLCAFGLVIVTPSGGAAFGGAAYAVVPSAPVIGAVTAYAPHVNSGWKRTYALLTAADFSARVVRDLRASGLRRGRDSRFFLRDADAV